MLQPERTSEGAAAGILTGSITGLKEGDNALQVLANAAASYACAAN
jgi:hypothetical protein